jgi:hypothetical protein
MGPVLGQLFVFAAVGSGGDHREWNEREKEEFPFWTFKFFFFELAAGRRLSMGSRLQQRRIRKNLKKKKGPPKNANGLF